MRCINRHIALPLKVTHFDHQLGSLVHQVDNGVAAQHVQRFAKGLYLSQNHCGLAIVNVPQKINVKREVRINLLTRSLLDMTQADRVSFEHVQDIHQRTRSVIASKHHAGFIVTSNDSGDF